MLVLYILVMLVLYDIALALNIKQFILFSKSIFNFLFALRST